MQTRVEGIPLFSGTSVQVEKLFECLETGRSIEQFLNEVPAVSRKEVIQALKDSKELYLARNTSRTVRVFKTLKRWIKPGTTAKVNMTAEVHREIISLESAIACWDKGKHALAITSCEKLLKEAREKLDKGEVRGGLYRVNAARRMCFLAVGGQEFGPLTESLRLEAASFASWHGEAIRKLLDADGAKDIHTVHKAMELRDKALELKYVWLKFVVRQRSIVASLAALGVISLILFFKLSAVAGGNLGVTWHSLTLVALAGWLGGCFASNLTIAAIPIDENLPDSTAVGVRTIFGSVFALAGFSLSKSGILASKLFSDEVGSVIALAFIFGFTGERLIPSLIGKAFGPTQK